LFFRDFLSALFCSACFDQSQAVVELIPFKNFEIFIFLRIISKDIFPQLSLPRQQIVPNMIYEIIQFLFSQIIPDQKFAGFFFLGNAIK